jgi:hypothetical protein
MGYASDHLIEMHELAKNGLAFQIDVPDGSGGKVWVRSGEARHVLLDGSDSELRIQWGETFPPKPIKVELVKSTQVAHEVDMATARGVAPVDMAVGLIQEAAFQLLKAGLPARDANALIGQLRNVAAQVRGFGGLADFPTVPFQPPRG